MLTQFVAEIFQVLLVQAAFHKGSRVYTRRGVPLEVDQISRQRRARGTLVRSTEEMVVADFQQGRERGVGGQMTADIGVVLVGMHHHGQCIPADQALDSALNHAITRISYLLFGGNRVHVGGVPAKWHLNAQIRGAFHDAFDQIGSPVGACCVDDIVERLDPFGGFLWIEVVGSFYFGFQHEGKELPKTTRGQIPR